MKQRSIAFKKKIAKLVFEGADPRKISSKYNIPLSTIYFWRKTYAPLKSRNGNSRNTQKDYFAERHRRLKLEEYFTIRKDFDHFSNDTLKERIQYISENQDKHSIHALCYALEVDRATYLRHRKKGFSYATVHSERRAQINDLVLDIFLANNACRGAKTISALIRDKYNIPVSRAFVGDILKEHGLISKHSVGYKEACYRKYLLEMYKLKKGYNVTEINQVWHTDCKKELIPSLKKYATLCTVEDVYSRKIVGYAFGKSESTRLVLRTLKRAIEDRKPKPDLIIHSDRGSGYRSMSYIEFLLAHKLQHRFSKPHYPKDNALMESFNSLLQFEVINSTDFKSMRDFREKISNFIEFYNSKRPHSSLGYISPNDFEENIEIGKK